LAVKFVHTDRGKQSYAIELRTRQLANWVKLHKGT